MITQYSLQLCSFNKISTTVRKHENYSQIDCLYIMKNVCVALLNSDTIDIEKLHLEKTSSLPYCCQIVNVIQTGL